MDDNVAEDTKSQMETGEEISSEKSCNESSSSPMSDPIMDEFTQEVEDQPVIIAQLFQLQDENVSVPTWNPICEGRVLLAMANSDCHLKIKSLIDHEIVFDTTVNSEIEYKLKEEDSNEFVAWKEQSSNQFTLSFASNSQCRLFYQQLQSFLKEGVIPMEIEIESNPSSPTFSLASLDAMSRVFEDKQITSISDCKLENLDKLIQLFDPNSLNNPSTRYFLSSRIIQQEFVPHLFDLFLACEKENNVAAMEQIFTIVKGLCKLENVQIFEMFLHPQNITQFARMMEYCPKFSSLPTEQKPSFLQHLNTENRFHEISVQNDKNLITDEMLRLVEHIFRLQYFREYVFPQVMEEDPIMNVSLLIRMCYKELFMMLAKNPSIFQLINFLAEPNSTTAPMILAVFQFLKEFFVTLKSYFILSYHGMTNGINFDTILVSINKSLANINSIDLNLIHLQLEVLSYICDQEGHILRDHVKLHCDEEADLFRSIIVALHQATDEYVRFNLTQCLKFVLHSASEVDDKFFTLFHSKYAPILVEPVIVRYNEANTIFSEAENDAIYCILDVFELCFIFHFLELKKFLRSNSFLDSTVWLLGVVDDKRLLLAILRFLRSLLTSSDEYFCTFFTKRTFLKSLVFLLEKHGNSNDMLISAVFSILERIKEDPLLRGVLVGLIENYGDSFREAFFSYNPIIQELLMAYEKLFESPSDGRVQSCSFGKFSALQNELNEEEYFANDDTSIEPSIDKEQLADTTPSSDDSNLPPSPKAQANEEEDFIQTSIPSKPKQMKIIIPSAEM